MKQRIPFLALLAILLAVFAAAAIGTRAESPTQPTQQQSHPYQQQNGIWYRDSAQSQMPKSAVDAGGPDTYGYTWNDSVPLNWIDVTKGTDTGMSGDTWDVAVGPITLPFAFNYYGNMYSKLYIAGSGYVAFTQASEWIAQPQGIPSPATPNNLIAPYASPFGLADRTGSNRVYYATGGTAPNRYFVVEWYQVQGTGPDNTYTFEVILHENGDIVFQYLKMDATYYCDIAGIENASGWTGLNYVSFCQPAPSNRAVRFYHPTQGARVESWPPYQGALVPAGATASYKTSIRNTGDLGADTYELNVVVTGTGWQAKLLGADGSTPLVDTNGNGIVDTGPVAKGALSTITVNLKAPDSATVGAHGTAQIALVSATAGAEKARFSVRAAIPAPFAQAVGERWDDAHPDAGAMRLNLILPAGQATRTVRFPSETIGYHGSLVETPDGFMQFWMVDTGLEYTVLNRFGDALRPATRLASASDSIYLTEPASAATPNGRVGVVWLETAYNDQWQRKTNLYFAILGADGSVVYGPVNLTGNHSFGDWCSPNLTAYRSPRIAATGNNRFLIGWDEVMGLDSGDCVSDVLYAVRDSAGSVVKSRTKLTDAVSGSGGDRVWLTTLTEDRVLASYEGPIGDEYGLTFVTLSSDG